MLKFDQVLKACSESEGEFSTSERASLCAELLAEFAGEGRDAWETLFQKLNSRLDQEQRGEAKAFLEDWIKE